MGLLLISCQVYARDFGIVGEVYPISEESILRYFQKQSHTLSAKAKLLKMNDELKEAAKAKIFEPIPSMDFPQADKYRCFKVDPGFTVQRDIEDVEGKVLVSRGTLVNPLDRVQPKSDLVFIDGRKKGQVLWLFRRLKISKRKLKVILTAGSPLKLSNKLSITVFYDQEARLTKKFRINTLPATVSVEKKHLLVEEWPI